MKVVHQRPCPTKKLRRHFRFFLPSSVIPSPIKDLISALANFCPSLKLFSVIVQFSFRTTSFWEHLPLYTLQTAAIWQLAGPMRTQVLNSSRCPSNNCSRVILHHWWLLFVLSKVNNSLFTCPCVLGLLAHINYLTYLVNFFFVTLFALPEVIRQF